MKIDFAELTKKHTNDEGVLDMEAYNAEVTEITQLEIGKQRKEERKINKDKHAKALEDLQTSKETKVEEKQVIEKGVVQPNEDLNALRSELDLIKQERKQEKEAKVKTTAMNKFLKRAEAVNVDVNSIRGLVDNLSAEQLDTYDVETLPKVNKKVGPPIPGNGQPDSGEFKMLKVGEFNSREK